MNYDPRRCNCGSLIASISFNIIDGDKPFTEVARIDVCGSCRIYHGSKITSRIFGISDDIIKRAFKATRITDMTMKQLQEYGASDYDPNKFIAPRHDNLEEVPF